MSKQKRWTLSDRDRFWVQEAQEQAEKAIEFADGDGEVHLMAMLKAVENLFESTTALSDEARSVLFPDPDEYADLRSVRNYYVHQYHRVDPVMARRTVSRHFPTIAKRASRWLSKQDP